MSGIIGDSPEKTREDFIRERLALIHSNVVSLSALVHELQHEKVTLEAELRVLALARSAGSAARGTPGASTGPRI